MTGMLSVVVKLFMDVWPTPACSIPSGNTKVQIYIVNENASSMRGALVVVDKLTSSMSGGQVEKKIKSGLESMSMVSTSSSSMEP